MQTHRLTRPASCVGAIFASACLFLFVLVSARAQTGGNGTITGRVLNEATGQYLRNAEVKVVGTEVTAISGDGGVYRLLGVPPGQARVAASYTGLDAKEITVGVAAGQTVTLDLNLTSADYDKNVARLGEFVVTTAREGNAKAIQEQRNATNMKTVISSDALGDVYEGNVGEFLKLMPGTMMDYVESDIRTVWIRGYNPKYAVVTMDGAPVASAGSSDIGVGRAFEFEQLSIASIETIEMTKTPTPADAASAVAGVVNLRSKGAFDRKGRRISWSTSLGANTYFPITATRTPGIGNHNTFKLQPNASAEFSDVFMNGKLGVLAGVNFSYSISPQAAEGVAGNGTIYSYDTNLTNNDTEIPRITQYTYRNGPKTTVRKNYNVRFDYRFSQDLRAWLRFDYNDYNAVFHNRDLTLSFNTVINANGPADPNVKFAINDQTTTLGGAVVTLGSGGSNNKYGDTSTLNTGLEYRRGSLLVFAQVQYSDAKNWYQDLRKGYFQGGNATLGAANTPTAGQIQLRAVRSGAGDTGVFIQQLAGPDWRNPANYVLGTNTASPVFNATTRRGKEQRWTPQVDMQYPLTLGNVPVQLKWGGQVAELYKDNERWNNEGYTYIGPDKIAGTADDRSVPAGPFMETNFRMDFEKGGNVDGLPTVDRFLLAQIYKDHPDYFTTDPAARLRGHFGANNDAEFKEQIDALYFQPKFKLGRFDVAPGVRYERTRSWGRGVNDIGDPATRRKLGLPPAPAVIDVNSDAYIYARFAPGRTASNDYRNYFKYLHANYRITDNFITRFSYHDAITRADPANLLAGITSINETNQTLNAANPDLKPERSRNFNLDFEYYWEPASHLTLGLFRSDIKDVQRNGITEILGPDGLDGDTNFAGWTVNHTVNLDRAHKIGFEVDYSQQLSRLPGVWRGLGVFANYTRSTPDNWDNFRGSTRNNANAGLSFRYKKLDTRFNANWQGVKYYNFVPATGERMYQAARLICGVNVNYSLAKNLTLFASGSNVFNSPMWTYSNRRDYFIRVYEGGTFWLAGVKGTF